MTVEQVFQAAVLALAGRFPCLNRRAFISGLRHELPRSLPADREETWPQMLALVAGNAATHEAASGYYSVRCSQCQSCVVNGVPIHERGCPNER